MHIYFQTLGCKVNQCETNAIRAQFIQHGYIPVETAAAADVLLVNSCTVTESSDHKVQLLLRKLRQANPNGLLVLTGCYPQAHADAALHCPEADLITGTKDRTALVSLVEQAMAQRGSLSRITAYHGTDAFESLPCAPYADKTRAFLKIQDGCNQFCSYCIIPFARGRCRSKPLSEIRDEAAMLAAQGHREIVLVGINLAFYGCECGLRLADAVEVCGEIPDIARIRLGSLEPEQLTEADLARFAAVPGFCPQFHLSLQSGCDRTLRAMNRRYTAAEYRMLVQRLRAQFPDCAITTDVMVGFPGETEQDFSDSLRFVAEIGFAAVHVFPYSRRAGTKADTMSPQLSQQCKNARARQMTQVAETARAAFLQQQIGKTVPVLFEREHDPAFHQGHAPNYVLVKIPAKNGEKSLRKSIFYVTIKSSESDCCIGALVNPC